MEVVLRKECRERIQLSCPGYWGCFVKEVLIVWYAISSSVFLMYFIPLTKKQTRTDILPWNIANKITNRLPDRWIKPKVGHYSAIYSLILDKVILKPFASLWHFHSVLCIPLFKYLRQWSIYFMFVVSLKRQMWESNQGLPSVLTKESIKGI